MIIIPVNSLDFIINKIEEEGGREDDNEVYREKPDHHLTAAFDFFQRCMLRTAERAFPRVITEVEAELFVLVFGTLKFVERYVFIFVILDGLKFDAVFVSLQQLYGRELLLVAKFTFRTKL